MPTDNVETAEQRPTSILRLISQEPLLIPATDGAETILSATDVFDGYIDPNFQNYGADEASNPTAEISVSFHKMVQDASFAEMFSSLGVDKEKLCLTQSQIIGFVKTHRQHLRTDGVATLFLFKSKGKFFVAGVRLYRDGPLEADVYRFGNKYVWSADTHRHVVVPQL